MKRILFTVSVVIAASFMFSITNSFGKDGISPIDKAEKFIETQEYKKAVDALVELSADELSINSITKIPGLIVALPHKTLTKLSTKDLAKLHELASKISVSGNEKEIIDVKYEARKFDLLALLTLKQIDEAYGLVKKFKSQVTAGRMYTPTIEKYIPIKEAADNSIYEVLNLYDFSHPAIRPLVLYFLTTPSPKHGVLPIQFVHARGQEVNLVRYSDQFRILPKALNLVEIYKKSSSKEVQERVAVTVDKINEMRKELDKRLVGRLSHYRPFFNLLPLPSNVSLF